MCVSHGEVVNFLDPEPKADDGNPNNRGSMVIPMVFVSAAEKRKESSGIKKRAIMVEEEKEWSEEDVEMLKKQMVKNSVGKPGRWEARSGECDKESEGIGGEESG